MPEAAKTISPENASSNTVIGKADKHIWGIYIFLLLISLVELYSASSREVIASGSFGVLSPLVRHGMMLGAGLVIVLLLQRVHYKYFIPATYILTFISVILMVCVLLFGEVVNGARRSISIGISIYPAELIKLSAVMVVSLIMARTQKKNGIGVTSKGVWYSAAAILFFSALLIKNGLTNTLLLMAISLSMMLIGGVKFRDMLLVLTIYLACGLAFLALFSGRSDEPYQEVKVEHVASAEGTTPTLVPIEKGKEVERSSTWTARISRWLDGDSIPKYDQKINATNRQEMYAYMAQANGGLIGVFPGNSRETARLPLAFSDFIYSIIIEDTGFVGGVFVLILYLWLLGRASAVASRCTRAYPALLVIGMAVMIVFQALFHMAIVTGVAPVSGQPLPLISKGGTSILVTSIAFGIMLSVSRFATGQKKREIKLEIDALPENMRAENPTQL